MTVVGFSPQHVGLVYALAGGAYTAGSITAGNLLGGLSPRLVVALSSVIGGVLVAAAVFVPGPAGSSSRCCSRPACAAAICSVSVVALLADESPAGAGTTMVLNGSVLNLGTAGGAVLGGTLIAFGGYPALGIGLPLFALVAAALAWWPGSHQTETWPIVNDSLPCREEPLGARGVRIRRSGCLGIRQRRRGGD